MSATKLTVISSYFTFCTKYGTKIKYKTIDIVFVIIFTNKHDYYKPIDQIFVKKQLGQSWHQNQKIRYDYLLYDQFTKPETLKTSISFINYTLCIGKLVWHFLSWKFIKLANFVINCSLQVFNIFTKTTESVCDCINSYRN